MLRISPKLSVRAGSATECIGLSETAGVKLGLIRRRLHGSKPRLLSEEATRAGAS